MKWWILFYFVLCSFSKEHDILKDSTLSRFVKFWKNEETVHKNVSIDLIRWTNPTDQVSSVPTREILIELGNGRTRVLLEIFGRGGKSKKGKLRKEKRKKKKAERKRRRQEKKKRRQEKKERKKEKRRLKKEKKKKKKEQKKLERERRKNGDINNNNIPNPNEVSEDASHVLENPSQNPQDVSLINTTTNPNGRNVFNSQTNSSGHMPIETEEVSEVNLNENGGSSNLANSSNNNSGKPTSKVVKTDLGELGSHSKEYILKKISTFLSSLH